MGAPRRRTSRRDDVEETETDDAEVDGSNEEEVDEAVAAPRRRSRRVDPLSEDASSLGIRRARKLVAQAPVVEANDPLPPASPAPRTPVQRELPFRAQPATTATPAYRPGPARELGALALCASAIFLTLAIASYDAVGGPDWVGPVGAKLAALTITALGLIAWIVPIELVSFAWPLLRGRQNSINAARLAGDVVLAFTSAALVHVGAAGRPVFGGHDAGGAIGELSGELLRALFSTVGTFLVGLTVIGVVLVTRASFSFIAFANRATETSAAAATKAADTMRDVADAWNQAKSLERPGDAPDFVRGADDVDDAIFDDDRDPDSGDQEVNRSGVRGIPPHAELRLRDDARGSPEAHEIARQLASDTPTSGAASVPAIALTSGTSTALAAPRIVTHGEAGIVAPKPTLAAVAGIVEAVEASAIVLDSTPTNAIESTDSTAGKSRKKRSRGDKDAEPLIAPPSPEAAVQKVVAEPAPLRARRGKAIVEAPSTVDVERDEEYDHDDEVYPPLGEGALGLTDDDVEDDDATDADASAEPLVTARQEKPKPVKTKIVPAWGAGFRLPVADLLAPPPPDQIPIDREALLEDSKALVATLNTYKVMGEVREIHPGPVVTTFEFEPTIGTKVRAVEVLANDLRLSLAKESVRIVAPIPGKNRIGFELPNAVRVPVNFRELVEDKRFFDQKGALPVVLGRDIVGAPFYADLAAMPHLLVAGATGAGKSVGLNVMLTSLLYRRTPEELRMIMIDPKVVELAPFDKIPHMLLPVVTDMKQALNALKWGVDEMERRYQLLAQAGVKNIGTYNAWCERVVKGEARNPLPRTATMIDHNNLPEEVVCRDQTIGEQPLPEKLPYLVIVVDEFADLMMSVGKGEVEPPIARLAQKARAAGIHLVLATQRPSVDVITGMIKANFPTRIAFRVAQRVDSRTILDAQGAEYLLGKGDMLVSLNGSNGLRRIQCPFVSEEEVDAVTAFLRAQGEPVFDESILANRDGDGGDDEEEEALNPKDQEIYDRCVEMVRENQKCSTSWLQRKMGLGYNKAARFVDRMERTGVVGPPMGAGKDREVLG